jgi:hypothetical protein
MEDTDEARQYVALEGAEHAHGTVGGHQPGGHLGNVAPGFLVVAGAEGGRALAQREQPQRLVGRGVGGGERPDLHGGFRAWSRGCFHATAGAASAQPVYARQPFRCGIPRWSTCC